MASTTTRTARRVLGGAVFRIREANALRLDPTAQKAGISAGYWCNIEKGRKQPTLPVMRAMAQALGVDLDDITYLTNVVELDESAA
jgi:transcriptional regulator with XRE-family HTH domain